MSLLEGTRVVWFSQLSVHIILLSYPLGGCGSELFAQWSCSSLALSARHFTLPALRPRSHPAVIVRRQASGLCS